MRMIKIVTMLAAFLFISIFVNAQDITKPFYFPHKTGDMWEYFYFEFGAPYSDTVQNFTIFDSTDSQGTIHINQYARRINPTQYPYFLLDTTTYTIDTLYNIFGPYLYNYENLLIYKLNANKGEQWVLFKYQESNYYEIARVQDKWEGTMFGKETSFMRMHYFSAIDSTDTTGGLTGLDRYWDEIADGFGLVFRVSAEYFGEIHLTGAVINDTLYGDTTLLSIKERTNFLPITTKLNQNYPNPFNPGTTISFTLFNPSNISLIIYDVLGKEVDRLIENKEFDSGNHKVIWNGLKLDGSKAASGMYIYRLQTNDFVSSKKMMLVK